MALGRSRQSTEWTYVLATIGAYVFTPEIRRLVDWRGNFDPLNTFAVVPLLMLCPIVVMVYRRRNRLRSQPFAFVALAWLVGFGYAAFIAAAHNAIIQACFDIAQFCLPLVVGAWLITRPETMQETHARIASTLLLFGAIAGAYGLCQYIFAPPWDTAWVQSVGATAFGTPERFGIRVFSVLNGPGVFALFVSAVILVNLPYFRLRSLFAMSALLLMIVGLMLSMVRSAWLLDVIGIGIFLSLSTKRLQAFLGLLSVSAITVAAALALLFLSPNADIGDKLLQRVQTLSNVGDDPSAFERRAETEKTFSMALEQPFGSGLGILEGGGAKLTSSNSATFEDVPVGPIDNGFAIRFFEMGLPGFAAFLLACGASIAISVNACTQFRKNGDESAAIVSASCIATQVAIFFVNISGDDQQGLLGVLFFIALTIPLMQSSNALSTDMRRHSSYVSSSKPNMRRTAFQ